MAAPSDSLVSLPVDAGRLRDMASRPTHVVAQSGGTAAEQTPTVKVAVVSYFTSCLLCPKYNAEMLANRQRSNVSRALDLTSSTLVGW